jgi:hypothetical protein
MPGCEASIHEFFQNENGGNIEGLISSPELGNGQSNKRGCRQKGEAGKIRDWK